MSLKQKWLEKAAQQLYISAQMKPVFSDLSDAGRKSPTNQKGS